jgi:hypothetical protein
MKREMVVAGVRSKEKMRKMLMKMMERRVRRGG